MAASPFQKLYRKLNPEQKAAVDAIEGPVMVVAGPGTGKTQILTLRIANILEKTDTPPDAILALTFTESAAFSMRKRLVEILGAPAYRIHIHTFHGFCNDVIARYPESFPRIIGAKSLTDVDKILLMQDLIESEPLERLRPFGDTFYYLHPILGAISSLKRENISPQEYERLIGEAKANVLAQDDLVHDKGAHKGKMRGTYQTELDILERSLELARMYRRYEEELAVRRLYDFEDMILEVVRALEASPEFLLRVQEEFLYILADEHQDANNAQNRLLELLSNYHESPNLFIVGDEKQAIYRFQGASLQNFLYFRNRYPSALLVSLKTNYRSGQGILDAAGSLMRASGVPQVGAQLLSARGAAALPEVRLLSFSTPDMELLFTAREVKTLLDEGVSPHEVAVLYRKNRDAAPLAAALERLGVPFVIESQENVLEDPEIRKLTTMMRAVSRFGEESLLFELLHMDFLGVEPLDVYKLAKYRLKQNVGLGDTLASMQHLKKAKVSKPAQLRMLYSLLSSFSTLARNKPALEALEHMLDESGYISHMLSLPMAVEKLAKLNGLVDSFKEAVAAHHAYTLADLVEYVALLERHNVSVRKDTEVLSPERVRLMTAHRSKGLEFDYVYVLGLQDGHWKSQGGKTRFYMPIGQNDEESENQDDRRLFYVSLTRARISATLTYSRAKEDGSPALPSQYIEEIEPTLLSVEDTAGFESTVSPVAFLSARYPASHSAKDKRFLNELFLDQGLSVTALNSYLDCPWRYFYGSLLRVPKAPDKYALFGVAVHAALKDLYESIERGSTLTQAQLLERFALACEAQPFSVLDLAEAKKKGEKALSAYWERYKDSWGAPTLCEFRINTLYPVSLGEAAAIPVRGVLDRVELGQSSEVVVYDYKTGRPKSRGEIEGTTKSSDGAYKRQLVFYKLLLSLYERGKWSMREGVIDFIEPDQKGRFHQERFFVEAGELEELKTIIERVAREIYDLDFWTKRCDDKKCEYCALRGLMAEPKEKKARTKKPSPVS